MKAIGMEQCVCQRGDALYHAIYTVARGDSHARSLANPQNAKTMSW
jgi:hypothetical protein